MSIWKKIGDKLSGESTQRKRKDTGAFFSTADLDPLEYELNAGGRVSLAFLQKLRRKLDADSFRDYLGCPVLIGSAIHQGKFAEPSTQARQRKATQAFIPQDIINEEESKSETLQQAIYPLLLTEKILQSNTPNMLKIGRNTDCDIVMPDAAISDHHARIFVDHGKYSLQDASSTNGTALNGVPITKDIMPLVDGCKIQFARYEFNYLSPAALYDFLS